MARRSVRLAHVILLLVSVLVVGSVWLIALPQQEPTQKTYYAVRHVDPQGARGQEHVQDGPALEKDKSSDASSVVAAVPSEHRTYPKIALILDDMGLDMRSSAEAIALPPEVTLSYLPYALRLPAQTRAAREQGHVLMLHMPMAPMGSDDPGPLAIHPAMSSDEVRRRLWEAFASFSGYLGVNNHMGSLATTDRAVMEVVATELKQRGLFFVDSRTTAKSVAVEVMQRHGVPVLGRHVFLDDQLTDKFISQQLLEVESIARQRGTVVAIGHPHALTLMKLRQWIPALATKGLVLVPVTDLLGQMD